MKNLILLAALVLTGFNAQAYIESCDYSRGEFVIVSDGNFYTQNVDDNFAGTVVNCFDNVAGLYDGDNFYVFDDSTKEFKSQFADDNFWAAQLVADNDIVALYDGDTFIIYNPATKQFDSQFAEDNFQYAQMGAYGGLVALYDGDDVIVYDPTKRTFFSQFAEDNYFNAVMMVNDIGVMVYDGDEIISYCAGRNFSTEFASDNAPADVLSTRNGPVGIAVGTDRYILNANCSIKKN
jgi:hypothetical protein